jgi:hypothetical protein
MLLRATCRSWRCASIEGSASATSTTSSGTGKVNCAWKPCCRGTRNATILSVLEANGPRHQRTVVARAYLQRVDQHHVPLDAMATVATALECLLKADGQATIRQVIKDREAFREAVNQLDADLQFRPEHVDRCDVNTRLRALVQQAGMSR